MTMRTMKKKVKKLTDEEYDRYVKELLQKQENSPPR